MYFIVYDNKDNIIAYIDSLDELATYFNRRKRQLKYEFKNKNFIQIQNKNIFYVYKFI